MVHLLFSFIHNGMICRIMNIAFITKDYGGRRGNGIKKCDPFESHRIKDYVKVCYIVAVKKVALPKL